LAGKQALIIGTGAYARVVAGALRTRGCTDLAVFSLSEREQAFAARHSARPVSALQLPTVLPDVDLLVACSGHTGGVLSAEMVAASRTRPLTVVDLALRPDTSAAVRALPVVRLIDLLTVSANAPAARSDAVAAAKDMVAAAVADFEEGRATRTLDPAVTALRSHVTSLVEREMIRLRRKYDDSTASQLELAMHRITQSLLHTPTVRAQKLARSGDGAGYLTALSTLFGIELPGSDGTGGDDAISDLSNTPTQWLVRGEGEIGPAVAV
jgi:glutamyl-tRNA reductase